MVNKIDATLSVYAAFPHPIKQIVEKIAEDILGQMKANQDRHNNTWFAAKSTLNVKTLQSLATEIRQNICKKLGIDDDSPILTETSRAAKSDLAARLNAYNKTATSSEAREDKKPVESHALPVDEEKSFRI